MDGSDEEADLQDELLASVDELSVEEPPPPKITNPFMEQLLSKTKSKDEVLKIVAKTDLSDSEKMRREKAEKLMVQAFALYLTNTHVMNMRKVILDENYQLHPDMLRRMGIPPEKIIHLKPTGFNMRKDYTCPIPDVLLQRDWKVVKKGEIVLSAPFAISVALPLVCTRIEGGKETGTGSDFVFHTACHDILRLIAPGICPFSRRDYNGAAKFQKLRLKEMQGMKGELFCANDCGTAFGNLKTNGPGIVDATDGLDWVIDGRVEKLDLHARRCNNNTFGSGGLAGPAYGATSFHRTKWELENDVSRFLCNRCNNKWTFRVGGDLGTVGSNPMGSKRVRSDSA